MFSIINHHLINRWNYLTFDKLDITLFCREIGRVRAMLDHLSNGAFDIQLKIVATICFDMLLTIDSSISLKVDKDGCLAYNTQERKFKRKTL